LLNAKQWPGDRKTRLRGRSQWQSVIQDCKDESRRERIEPEVVAKIDQKLKEFNRANFVEDEYE